MNVAMNVDELVERFAMLGPWEERYRYPIDPLMYVMAAGGLVGLVGSTVRLSRRLARRPEPEHAAPVTSPTRSPA